MPRLRSLTLLTAAASVLVATPLTASAAPQKAPKCFGKKPTVVLSAKNATLTLTSKTKNAVVDLLGAGEKLDASKAKGNTLVCDTGGAKSITTGNGNDKVTIKNGSPHISTGPGQDTFTQTGTGNPVVHLGDGVDVGNLNKGNGIVYGDGGNDVLKAGSATTGKHNRQQLIGGQGRDTLFAGKATATLDGSDPGTSYVIPVADTGNTTVVLRAGDVLNGKPYPAPTKAPVTPVQAGPAPAAIPPVPPVPPIPALPTGTIVGLAPGVATSGVAIEGEQVFFTLTGPSGNGRTTTGWSLDFGDGSPVESGVGMPPAQRLHLYVTAGSYTAALTLIDDLGRTVTSTAVMDIAGETKTSLNAPSTQASLKLQGTATDSPGARASINSSTLDFGDGSQPQSGTTSPAAFTHTYANPGSYYVDLSVTDDHGGSDSEGRTVALTDASPHAVLRTTSQGVAGSVSSAFTTAKQAITFYTNQSVAATGSTITKVSLDAGDGKGAQLIPAGASISATYASQGTYTATLTITDSDGTVSTPVKTVVYVAAPPAVTPTLTTAATSAVAGQTLTFNTAESAGTAPTGAPAADNLVTRIFNFGDGTPVVTTSVDSVTHTYARPGSYIVGYTVGDSYGELSVVRLASVYLVVSGAAPYVSVNGDYTVDTGLNTGDTSFGTDSPWVGTSLAPNGSSLQTLFDIQGIGSAGHASGVTYRVDFGDGSTAATGSVDTQTGSVDGGNPFYPGVPHTYTSQGEFTVTISITDTTGQTATETQHVSAAGAAALTLGTPSAGADAITIPVTSVSAGAGAVGESYTVTATDAKKRSFQQVFTGTPGTTISLPAPAATAPISATVSYLTDHAGFITATAKSS